MAIVVALLVGIAIGVACTIAVMKFIIWMKGKSLTFSPWPRIHSDA